MKHDVQNGRYHKYLIKLEINRANNIAMYEIRDKLYS